MNNICMFKLKSIEIENLFNLYNYNIKLNDDVNFMYGKNGCGKTTILNIIEFALKGDFKNLLKYEFKKIKFIYFDIYKKDILKELVIIKDKKIFVIFDKAKYSFNNIIFYNSKDTLTINEYQEKEKLKNLKLKIEKEFNYNYPILKRELLIKIDKLIDELVLDLHNIYNIYEKNTNSRRENNIEVNEIDKYISIINDFIYDSEIGKKLVVNKNGKIVFLIKGSNEQIDINKLSYGEKRLLIIFYKLIFSYKKSIPIFIIDEPELSFNLIWQKVFIENILKIREDIQIIVATHSPEIINRYRNKMIKLSNSKV